jgi:hypothetical protein
MGKTQNPDAGFKGMQLCIRTVTRKCRIQILALKGRGFSRAVAQEN